MTGTLLDGKIHSGDRVMIYPQQTSCRVRGVQVHEQEAEACEAGQPKRTEPGSDGPKTEQ